MTNPTPANPPASPNAMKTFVRNALAAGVPFGFFMGLFYSDRGTGALAMGIANGVLFGCAMAWFMARQQKRSATLRAAFSTEGVVHDGAANFGAAGGWLFLTKQRLVFEPHKMNLGLGKRKELALTDIAGVRAGDGVLANKLAVETRDNQTVQFVVRNRDEWLAKFREVVAAPPPKAVARIRES